MSDREEALLAIAESGQAISETYWRNKIAQEIEQTQFSVEGKCKCGEPLLVVIFGKGSTFAAIARGQK